MGKVLLTDAEIRLLLDEPKILPRSFERKSVLKPRRGHSEAQFDLGSSSDHSFCIILRQSHFNTLDFSAILGYHLMAPQKIFLLKRYNGKSHQHTNSIENETFYDFHIHEATERYQAMGCNEERYAVVTARYSTLLQAFDCLAVDCHLIPEDDDSGQMTLLPKI
jgi:hypothetical protein